MGTICLITIGAIIKPSTNVLAKTKPTVDKVKYKDFIEAFKSSFFVQFKFRKGLVNNGFIKTILFFYAIYVALLKNSSILYFFNPYYFNNP